MFDCGRCESSFSFSLLTDPCRGRRDFIESLLQASSPFIRPLLTPTHTFQYSAFALRHHFPQSYHFPPADQERERGKKNELPGAD